MSNNSPFLPPHLLQKQGNCTISDYLSLPLSARAQLVEGTFIPSEPVTLRHQQIILGLISQMVDFLHTPASPWKIITSPIRLAFPGHNDCVFLPDLAIIHHPGPLEPGLLTAMPVLAAEVLSRQSRQVDTIQKARVYQAVGCKEYWVIDPAKEVVYVHIFNSAEPTCYSFGETIQVQSFPGLFCSIPAFK